MEPATRGGSPSARPPPTPTSDSSAAAPAGVWSRPPGAAAAAPAGGGPLENSWRDYSNGLTLHCSGNWLHRIIAYLRKYCRNNRFMGDGVSFHVSFFAIMILDGIMDKKTNLTDSVLL